MKKKQIISGVLTGALSASMIVPAAAAGIGDAVIDEARKGTLNIHKIIENDGQNTHSDGLADPNENRAPVDNIGFDYVKVATIENVTGIIISDDGELDWDADGGRISAGAYYKPTEKFRSLMDSIGIVPKPTLVKTGADADPSYQTDLEYEYNDNRANSVLAAEQAALNGKKTALDAALAALQVQQGITSGTASGQALAQRALEIAQQNRTDAQNERDAAQAARDAAVAALGTESDAPSGSDSASAWANLNYANAQLSAAEQDMSDANTALNNAKAEYSNDSNVSPGALQALNKALSDFHTADAALEAAKKNQAQATAAMTQSEDAFRKATAAYDAACDILDAATAAQAAAITANPAPETPFEGLGTADSVDGTTNAVAYAEKQKQDAEAAKNAAEQAYNDAVAAANNAKTATQTAANNMTNAVQALANAQNQYGLKSDALNAAIQAARAAARALADAANAQANALEKKNEAASAAQSAIQALTNAQNLLSIAQDQLQTAQTAYFAAQTGQNTQSGNLGTSQDPVTATTAWGKYNKAKAEYDAALAAFMAAASSHNIETVYTAQDIQEAMQAVINTLSEADINRWVAENAPTQNDTNALSTHGQLAEGYTDDHGTVTFSGMDLGLYLVAETDISYHDGIAGAWSDGRTDIPNIAVNQINNDQQNRYDVAGGTYYITPIDGHDQGTVHTYQAGEAYRESVNPELPVVDTPASPFFVSLPTTNSTDTTENSVAAGDNYGEAGTVWQYTVDVYPKNQTNAIYKRIIDPDEETGNETLRTSEDFQMGDIIEQIIWADAPKLQPNYLAPEDAAKANKHEEYIITDTMQGGIRFEGVTKVVILPAKQLKGANSAAESAIYTDGEGAQVSSNAGAVVKYFDQAGHEISAATFTERTGVAANPANLNFYTDIGQDGVNHGSAGNIYNAKAGLTGTYYVTRTYSKFITEPAYTTTLPTSGLPQKAGAFAQIISDTQENAQELVYGTDYEVIDASAAPVTAADSKGNISTVMEQGTQGFAVKLTPAGLAKLNAREADSTVAVYFDTSLTKDAKIGQVAQNMNFPSLFWANTNTALRSISGNEVYDYTYELNIRKEGVKDGANVKFVVARKDTNDLNQAAEKDMSGFVAGINRSYDETTGANPEINGVEDQLMFVEEAPGVYHVLTTAETPADAETSTVNGKTYYTVTPKAGEDATLIIKGLDSDTFTFKEIKTEQGKNLLKSTFDVVITAADDAADSLRDGRIKTATVQLGNNAPTNITIGIPGMSEQDSMGQDVKNLGIAGFNVTNNSVVDLRTGGAGRTMLYIIGVALVGGMSVGMYAAKRRKDAAETE